LFGTISKSSTTWTFTSIPISLTAGIFILEVAFKNSSVYFLTTDGIYKGDYTNNTISNVSKMLTINSIYVYNVMTSYKSMNSKISTTLLSSSIIRSITFVIDSQENIYITNPSSNSVYKYAAGSTGTTPPVESFSTFSDASGSFNNPAGMCVDANDYVYVADSSNNAIRVISPSGVVNTVITTGLTNPYLISIDSNGYLFVVCSSDPGNGSDINVSSLKVVTIKTSVALPFINTRSQIGTYNYSVLTGASFSETLNFTQS
jgi:sugar lactone lactonase YvrE